MYSSTNKVYGDLEWVRYDETETRYAAPDYPPVLTKSAAVLSLALRLLQRYS